MDTGEPDKEILTLDLHAIRDEEWEALMESQLAPDDLLAAVLLSWREKDAHDSPDGYAAADGQQEDDVLHAAEE